MRLPAWWPKALLALGVLVALRWYAAEQRHRGEADQRIKAREVTIAVLAKQKARVDTQYAAGKIVYRTARQRWDSLKVTLGDRVKIDPVVIAGDSLAQACDSLTATCELRAHIADSIATEQVAVIRELKKLKPSRFGCVAGGTASTKGAGLGVACGIRITK